MRTTPPQPNETQKMKQKLQPLSPVFKRHIPNAASETNGTARNEERASLRLSSGARQLREHELSFFGVTPNNQREATNPSSTTASSISTKSATNTNFKRSTTLTSSFIKRNSINMNPSSTTSSSNSSTNQGKSQTATKSWQLTNDKPDLLRHSQRADSVAVQKTTSTSSASTALSTSTSTMSSVEPHYENLVKSINEPPTVLYDRKQDLKRDEQILEELTRAADEILNVYIVPTDWRLSHTNNWLYFCRLLTTCRMLKAPKASSTSSKTRTAAAPWGRSGSARRPTKLWNHEAFRFLRIWTTVWSGINDRLEVCNTCTH